MDKLLNETVEIARNYFLKLGFKNEQIAPLIESGKRDLTKELLKLQKLLEKHYKEIDTINLSLHALKGLFLTMGNITIADKLLELHHENVTSHDILEIKKILGI